MIETNFIFIVLQIVVETELLPVSIESIFPLGFVEIVEKIELLISWLTDYLSDDIEFAIKAYFVVHLMKLLTFVVLQTLFSHKQRLLLHFSIICISLLLLLPVGNILDQHLLDSRNPAYYFKIVILSLLNFINNMQIGPLFACNDLSHDILQNII